MRGWQRRGENYAGLDLDLIVSEAHTRGEEARKRVLSGEGPVGCVIPNAHHFFFFFFFHWAPVQKFEKNIIISQFFLFLYEKEHEYFLVGTMSQ